MRVCDDVLLLAFTTVNANTLTPLNETGQKFPLVVFASGSGGAASAATGVTFVPCERASDANGNVLPQVRR
jgi:hypothetical protein